MKKNARSRFSSRGFWSIKDLEAFANTEKQENVLYYYADHRTVQHKYWYNNTWIENKFLGYKYSNIYENIRSYFATDLLVADIQFAEQQRQKLVQQKSHNAGTGAGNIRQNQQLLSIKNWPDGICIYHGIKPPLDLPKAKMRSWNNNFNTWDGTNRPFNHQHWRRANQTFRKDKINHNIQPKDRSIFLQQKFLNIYDAKKIEKELIDVIKASDKPIAFAISSSNHTIALGGSKKMGCFLINHDILTPNPTVIAVLQAFCPANTMAYGINPKVFYIEQFGIKSVDSIDEHSAEINFLQLSSQHNVNLINLALKYEFTNTIRTYMTEILNSSLADNTKIQLLVAESSTGVPWLYLALENGHAQAIAVYLKINLPGLATEIINGLYPQAQKWLKDMLLQWTRDKVPNNNKQEIIRQYPLLTQILSIHRSTFFNHGQTSSMKALARLR